MTEKNIGPGGFFMRELIKAGTWCSVIFILIMVLSFALKKEIKEGIAFGIDRLVTETVMFALDPDLINKTKQLVKEGLEYSVVLTSSEWGRLLEERGIKVYVVEEKDSGQRTAVRDQIVEQSR